jgi:hypothetical protein
MTLLIVFVCRADRRLYTAQDERDEQEVRGRFAQAHSHSTTLKGRGSSNTRGLQELGERDAAAGLPERISIGSMHTSDRFSRFDAEAAAPPTE